MNEPHMNAGHTPDSDARDWPTLVQDTIAAIRPIDNKVTIVIEPMQYASPALLWQLPKFSDQYVIYSIHFYTPADYCLQGISKNTYPLAYPGNIDGAYWDINLLKAQLQTARDWQLTNNVHIFVGEFSTARWAPGAAKWLSDMVTIFAEWDWDYTYVNFRECDCWDLEFNNTYGVKQKVATTDRKEVMLAAWSTNTNPYL
eukprot:Phypoly_transcript_19820.p1 GENE.Phypoly_transcript_19820~~Phypoly_transcript_19820.p1  ORF type:complete len:220 (+),score=17.36 Phypoly_transcript_19820:63-662(+)